MKRTRLAVILLLLLAPPSFASVREGTTAPGTPDPAALLRLQSCVDSTVALGKVPVVIFDIDGTLTDPAPRTRAIFEAYASKNPKDAAGIRKGITSVPLNKYAYAPESTLTLMGIRDTALVHRIGRTWVTGFFSNHYLSQDRELVGAAAYVTSLFKRGALIVYLTGRDVPRMLEGTAASLRDQGFPIASPRAVLVMKPDPKEPDLEFKKKVFDDFARLGAVVGVFENEPANLTAMQERFPDAIAVFVDTTHDPKKTDVVRASAAWVRNFRIP
ncbi:MAG TPA: HAD family hydrolase [Candidatus Eisenbacteria bacterium]|nr:HAD family hydrolase [Candidatus Eisenbacteria bacterium]